METVVRIAMCCKKVEGDFRFAGLPLQIWANSQRNKIPTVRIVAIMRTELFMFFFFFCIKNYIGTQSEVRAVKGL